MGGKNARWFNTYQKYCFCDVLAEFFLDIFFIGKKFLAGFYCVFKVFLAAFTCGVSHFKTRRFARG